jgi:hypothetical protein
MKTVARNRKFPNKVGYVRWTLYDTYSYTLAGGMIRVASPVMPVVAFITAGVSVFFADPEVTKAALALFMAITIGGGAIRFAMERNWYYRGANLTASRLGDYRREVISKGLNQYQYPYGFAGGAYTYIMELRHVQDHPAVAHLRPEIDTMVRDMCRADEVETVTNMQVRRFGDATEETLEAKKAVIAARTVCLEFLHDLWVLIHEYNTADRETQLRLFAASTRARATLENNYVNVNELTGMLSEARAKTSTRQAIMNADGRENR